MDESNPFVISKTEEDVAAEAAPPMQGLEDGDEVTVEKVGNVEDLIPLCVKHASGPQLNTATFGYDIAQMERRPWEDAGAKQSDYFNYGFNETSWRLYCAMQTDGEESLAAKAEEMLRKLKLVAKPEATAAAGEEAGRSEAIPPYDPSAGTQPPYSGGFDRRGGIGGGGAGGGDRMFYKTKLCQRFAEGRCTKGSECSYAHGVGELRSAPVSAVGGGGGYGPEGPSHFAHPHHHHHHHQHHPGLPFHGGVGYMPPPQPYGMVPFRAGGNMGPMPMYDGNGGPDAFHMGPKRPRGEGGEY